MNGCCLYDLWLPVFSIQGIFHVSNSEDNSVQKQDKTTMLAAGSNGEIWCFEVSLENAFGKNKCMHYKKVMYTVQKVCVRISRKCILSRYLMVISVHDEEKFSYLKETKSLCLYSTGSFVNGCIQKIVCQTNHSGFFCIHGTMMWFWVFLLRVFWLHLRATGG